MTEIWKYNGVPLPALPEWDRERLPYATILESLPRPEHHGYTYRKRYKLWLSKDNPYYHTRSLKFAPGIVGNHVRVFELFGVEWKFRYDMVKPAKEFAEGSPFEENLFNYALFSININWKWNEAPTAKVLWANVDIPNAQQHLWFAASEPEKLPHEHWDAAVAGLLTGKRLRALENGIRTEADFREGVLHIQNAAAALRGGILEVR